MAREAPVLSVFFGTDDGLVQEHASRRFRELAQGVNELSCDIIEATVSDSESAALACRRTIEAIQTMPFFPGPKVVWMKNVNFLGDSAMSKSETADAALSVLGRLIEQGLPEDVSLVISAAEFDKRRSFNKLLVKIGECREFNKPDTTQDGWEAEVANLILHAASERSLEFERDALDLMTHRVSESSRQIVSEVEKLALFLGERRVVTEQDVYLMVPQTRTGIVFEIARAIETGRTADAVSMIDAQLERGEQAVGIIRAAIIPTLRNLVTAKTLCGQLGTRAMNYREFTSRIESLPSHARGIVPLKKDGTPNVYPLFLASQKVRNFSLDRLKKSLSACFEADKALVSSTLDARLVLHRLVISISS